MHAISDCGGMLATERFRRNARRGCFTIRIEMTSAAGLWRRKQPLFEKSGAKTFVFAGPGAVSATMPMAQHKRSFLLLFVHKKKPSLAPS
jgi:hypothetical protein